MTIAFVNAGTFASGTTSVASAYGAGSATDIIIHCIGNKPFSSTPTQASNTLINSITSGSVANAVSSGSVMASAWSRDSSPTGAGSDTFSVTSGSPTMGKALRFSGTLGAWNVFGKGMADTTETGTGVSASTTGGFAAGDIANGDWIVINVVLKDDAITHTSQTLSIPGCTVGTITWQAVSTTSTGNDGAQYTGYAAITAGSSTVGGNATYTATSNTSGASSTAVNLVRIREAAAYAGPVWQSVGTPATAGAGTSAAPTLPGSIAANDIVVVDLYIETGTQPTVTPPSGFTQEIVDSVTTNNTLSHYLFWKRMSGGESGTVTFSWSGSFWKEATAHRISGCVTSGNPFMAITSADSGGSSVTGTPVVSLSGLSGDTLLFWSSTNWNGGGDVTPPSGFTERHDGGTIGSATKQHQAATTGSIAGSWNISDTQAAILGALTNTASGASVTLTPATGTASAIAPTVTPTINLSPAQGTASAVAPTVTPNLAISPALGTFSAVPLSLPQPPIPVTLTPAAGTFSAIALTATPVIPLTPAAGTFSAVAPTVTRVVSLTPATGTFSAIATSVQRLLTLSPALGTASAIPLTVQRLLTLSPATGTASAIPLTVQRLLSITPALGTFSAIPLGLSGSLSAALGTFSAVPLSVTRIAALQPAQGTFSATPLIATRIVPLTPALGTFSAVPFTVQRKVTLSAAGGTFSANPLILPVFLTLSPATGLLEAIPLSLLVELLSSGKFFTVVFDETTLLATFDESYLRSYFDETALTTVFDESKSHGTFDESYLKVSM